MQKINTVWWRDEATHRFKPEVYPGCEWVLDEVGFASEKLDGTNVMVYLHGDGGHTIHKRKSPKKADKVLDIQPTNIPVSPDDPNDKWIIESVEHGLKYYQERGYCNTLGVVYGEALGPKIQGNYYELDHHTWIPFLPGIIKYVDCPRSFDGMQGYLQSAESTMFPGRRIEGVVFRWAWGMAKAKGRDFPG